MKAPQPLQRSTSTFRPVAPASSGPPRPRPLPTLDRITSIPLQGPSAPYPHQEPRYLPPWQVPPPAYRQVYAVEVGPLYAQAPITVTAQDNGTNTSMSCQLIPSQAGSPAASCSTSTSSVNAGNENQYSLTQIIPPPPGTSSFGQVGTTLICQNP